MALDNYTAQNIKILDGIELAELPYMKIQVIVEKYGKPFEIVESAYQACLLAGLDFDDFYIAKYCKGEDIPRSEEFLEIYQDIRNIELDKLRKTLK